MALIVVAQTPSEYDAWAAAQRRPADEPSDPQAKHGRDVFVSSSCAMCHTIDGTDAQAQHAPNLTHIASRQTLAAGTLDNTPAIRAAWITDPQSFKPGVNMPPHMLSGDDFNALLAYLATLK
jgi:cytochrome c oxidase subunit 2